MSDDVEEPCSGTGSRSAGRDIRRAAAVVGRLRGLTVDDAVVVLHDHAALTGVSLHTAALAVLAEWHPHRWSNRGVPAAQTYVTPDGAGRIVLRWQARETAHLGVGGVCSGDLAARLRRAVDRGIRAGLRHLTVDVHRTSGRAAEFDETLDWACRRLWARRGVVLVRGRALHDPVPRTAAPTASSAITRRG